VAGLELLLIFVKYGLLVIRANRASAALGGWIIFLLIVLSVLLVFLGLRWFRNYVMWRVRNRLIVTYLFIGGVPVVLTVLMAVSALYLLTSQFATFLVNSEIQAQLKELQAANSETAQQVARSPSVATGAIRQSNALFPGLTVQVLPASQRPKWLTDGFNEVVLNQGKVYLCAANLVEQREKQFAVVTSAPVNKDLLVAISRGMGPVALYVQRNTGGGISAGALPPPEFRGDRALDYVALIQPREWDTGKLSEAFTVSLVGSVRISTLYSRLSESLKKGAEASSSKEAEIVRIILTVLAIVFAVIVLAALLIGIRLTRTITRSVANLYDATQHINRGDFRHRIDVKERDQLATLQVAFNSMTESLEKLIAEQKEKERLQSELEIAQEVQAQLFPKAASGTSTLELWGVCRPARIVSGDYYDFLPYGSEQMGIALGDISGKGISAALLMATIHSAVRAYEQEQLISVSAARSSAQSTRSGSVGLAISHVPPQSPSQVLWLLNRQLYRTTQPEKYATLFLGFYDGHARHLTYSNAGHLPPLILAPNGSVRRLDIGGTVVGLFESVDYQESTVELHPGDIFIAFSDGIIEPENEFGEFGEERLIETIEAHRNQPLDRITDAVIAAVQDWIGSAEQPDDITLVLARSRN